MIPRYTLPEMERIWSDENKFQKWLDVEIAVCEELAERGEIPKAALAEIKQKARFSVARIFEIEKEVKHDVIAFLTSVAENVGDASRYIHLGLTSTDVVDTAQAVQFKEASALIRKELEALQQTLRAQADRYRKTPMVGRTHGIHAEPTTLGLKFALWYSELQRNLRRFDAAAKAVCCGKISGAVGTFAHLPPDLEESVCSRLGIDFAAVSTQTLQRDRHAEFMAALAILGATYDKIATEIRHLQRTEVGEMQEPFGEKQKGSSAMPHKRNPITCEQISGLSRVLRGYLVTALENIPLWHERDISHSSAERVIFPDATMLAQYLTRQVNRVLSNLVVNEEKMKANLELTRGGIYSGQLLVELARKGVLREDAYQWVQRNALKAWDENLDFEELVKKDPDIGSRLSAAEIGQVFNLDYYFHNVDKIFERVFGK
ncbi:MAG TPA: adenylosuccinate lyase [Acidobacteriota bacterium]|jgi:adenylosuccinate lyase|nr:adenylosuccinate lyase [Acidobacteriota bacterium]